MNENQTKARIEWIVHELLQSGMQEDEIVILFQECIDKVKKEKINKPINKF